MVSIRELAMGSEPEPIKYTNNSGFGKNFEDNDGYGYGDYDYGTKPKDKTLFDKDPYESSYKPYSPPKKGQITITMEIPYEDLKGLKGTPMDTHYDWTAAELKATEAAYDKVEELLGKNYEAKYTVTFEVIESIEEFEVTVKLIPVK